MLVKIGLRAALMGVVLAAWSALAVPRAACAGEVSVAVATNFRSVLEGLRPDFERQTGHRLILSAGSTGKLYAQIGLGAPFDVFLSADQDHARKLVDRGLAIPGSRFTYAVGLLTLWTPQSVGWLDENSLSDPALIRLALANPDLAPYGRAATDLIHALGLGQSLSGKLVLGENVGQAFAFVQSRNAQLGFVALSQVLSLPAEKRGARWDPPVGLYRPIRQDAVLLQAGRDNPAASAFMAFLESEPIQGRLPALGYAP